MGTDGLYFLPNDLSVKMLRRLRSEALNKDPAVRGSLCLALVIMTSFRTWTLGLSRKAVKEKKQF